MRKLGNTSAAVMNQRHEAHDSLDDYPSPPWAVRGFIEQVLSPLDAELAARTVWEPACNRGYMARPLGEYFGKVIATDVHDYGWEGLQGVADFLIPGLEPEGAQGVDWIITNPPFRLAQQFAERALQLAPRRGFALLVRTNFIEGVQRYEELFAKWPPSILAQYSERVPMVQGRHDPNVSSATGYAWLVWLTGDDAPPRLQWIAKCRARLQRRDDVVWRRRTEGGANG